MDPAVFFWVIVGAILIEYGLDTVVALLNVRAADPVLPPEFDGIYDRARYAASQRYLRDRTRFSIVKDTFTAAAVLVLIASGALGRLDGFVRSWSFPLPLAGLSFAGILAAAFSLASVPFSAYSTFVIEQRYGFNRMNVATFVTDLFKGWVIGALIGAFGYVSVILFFTWRPADGWLWCWAVLSAFKLFLIFLYPVMIMPLFNRFVPLAPGPLREAIERYAREQRFAVGGIFTMDASRRSSKSNAFFTGFGRSRRIALFDTLIARHTPEELLSVLAHEVGHYKKGHILQQVALSIGVTGVMLALFSVLAQSEALAQACGVEQASVYVNAVLFTFLFKPVSMVLSIGALWLSRRHEFEADEFSLVTYRHPGAFIAALKRLSADNLGNLTPHPLMVFFSYTHPPILTRIARIRAYVPAPRRAPQEAV